MLAAVGPLQFDWLFAKYVIWSLLLRAVSMVYAAVTVKDEVDYLLQHGLKSLSFEENLRLDTSVSTSQDIVKKRNFSQK
ncbi:hypothetical protein ABVT39_020253 [Epinephelus coioides]